MIYIDVLVVSRCLERIIVIVFVDVIERNIKLAALTRSLPAVVHAVAVTSWIVNTVVVTVDGEEQNVWVLLEDRVSTVTVVNVPIDYCNFLQTIFVLKIARSNCYIIEYAKTIDGVSIA
jgi:hypothetical protein